MSGRCIKRFACVAIIGVFFPSIHLHSQESSDEAQTRFSELYQSGGQGMICKWQLMSPNSPASLENELSGTNSDYTPLVSGICPVKFETNESGTIFLVLENFMGEGTTRLLCGSQEVVYLDRLYFPTNLTDNSINDCYFYSVVEKAPSNTTNVIKVQFKANTKTTEQGYLTKTVNVTSRQQGLDTNGNPYVEIGRPTGLVASCGKNPDIVTANPGVYSGTTIYFTKLRLEFSEGSVTGQGHISSDPEVSVYSSDDYTFVADISEDGTDVYISNLYGTGTMNFAETFNLAAINKETGEYPEVKYHPAELKLESDGTVSFQPSDEILLRSAWTGTYKTSDKTLTFTVPGNNFTFTGFVAMTSAEAEALSAELASKSDFSARSPIIRSFYNRLKSGNLAPVTGSWKQTAESSAINSHWYRQATGGRLDISLDRHTLVPVKITHDDRFVPYPESDYIDLIWTTGTPIDIRSLALSFEVPDDFAAPSGSSESVPATFNLDEFGDNGERVGSTSDSRVLYIKGTLTLAGEHGQLYICRGDIDDYTSEALADPDKGHTAGTCLYDSHSVKNSGTSDSAMYVQARSNTTVHNIESHLNLRDLPENNDGTEPGKYTLYAAVEDPDTEVKQFVKLRTLSTGDITTDVSDPTGASDIANHSYTIEGRVFMAVSDPLCEEGQPVLTVTATDGRILFHLYAGESRCLLPGVYLVSTVSATTKIVIR